MAPKAVAREFPMRPFATPADFDAFLEKEHATAEGLYVKLAKKSSGIPSITAAEAVEVALCHGWIDGRGNSIDETWWTVRYTPRRAKSIWSQKNVETVARLIDEGRMRPAGLAAVEAAKADGRWDRAYAGPASVTIPNDLVAALADEPAAEAFWQSLNKSKRWSTLHRLQTCSDANRAKTVADVVQGLVAQQKIAIGEIPDSVGMPLPLPKAKAKAKSKPKRAGGVTKPSAAKKSNADKLSAVSRELQTPSRREGLRTRKT